MVHRYVPLLDFSVLNDSYLYFRFIDSDEVSHRSILVGGRESKLIYAKDETTKGKTFDKVAKRGVCV